MTEERGIIFAAQMVCGTEAIPILAQQASQQAGGATNQGQTTNTGSSNSQPGGAAQRGSGNLTYVPLEPLPGVPQGGDANFADLITGFFKLLVNLGAFIAVTMLVIGGITYMVSASTVTKFVAKEKIKAAFWGMAILAGAWLILNTINPQLLMFNKELVGPAAGNPTTGGSGFSNTVNIGKFNDDCVAGGGHVDNHNPSGPVCTK